MHVRWECVVIAHKHSHFRIIFTYVLLWVMGFSSWWPYVIVHASKVRAVWNSFLMSQRIFILTVTHIDNVQFAELSLHCLRIEDEDLWTKISNIIAKKEGETSGEKAGYVFIYLTWNLTAHSNFPPCSFTYVHSTYLLALVAQLHCSTLLSSPIVVLLECTKSDMGEGSIQFVWLWL